MRVGNTSGTLRRYQGWWICILAALFYCYEYLLRIMPSVMVPQLMHFLSLNAAGVGMLISLYYFAYTPMQALVGVIIDYYGARYILIVAICLCVFGSVFFGAFHWIVFVGIGRFLLGLGSAFAFIGTLKLASDWLPQKYFSFFAGLTAGLGMAGAMVGDVILSRSVGWLGWREVIFVGTVFGIFLLPLFVFFVFDRSDTNLASADRPVPSFKALFINLGNLLLSKQILLSGLVGCILYLPLSVFAEMWGVSFLHSLSPMSTVHAANLNSMVFLGWLIGAPFNGWLSEKIGSRRGLLVIGSALTAAMFALILFYGASIMPYLGLVLFLFGLFSSVQVLVFAIGQAAVSSQSVATALALINLMIMLGGMIFQPLVGMMLDWSWQGTLHAGNRVYLWHDFQHSLLIIPVMSLLAMGFSLLIKEQRSKVPAIK